jgi:surface polysaccharide O-acyltransferase-like enzyme
MSRNIAFDYARAVAIICVVIMHSTLEYVFTPTAILIDSFLHNLVIVGVPLFFFMAGYFLSVKPGSNVRGFIGDKVSRIYLPSVFWTIVLGIVFSVIGNTVGLDIGSIVNNVILLTDPAHYYFTIALMLLFIPGYFVLRLNDTRLRQVVLVSFLINFTVIISYEIAIWVARSQPDSGLPGHLMYRNPFTWIFFFMYGVYISRVNRRIDRGLFKWLSDHKVLGLGLALVLWIITSWETWTLYVDLMPGAQDYFKVASFLYEIIAIHYILVALQTAKLPQWVDQPARTIARYSFFIYLVHIPLVPKLLGTDRLVALSDQYFLSLGLRIFLYLIVPLMIVFVMKQVARVLPVEFLFRLVGLPNLVSSKSGVFQAVPGQRDRFAQPSGGGLGDGRSS